MTDKEPGSLSGTAKVWSGYAFKDALCMALLPDCVKRHNSVRTAGVHMLLE